MKDRLINRFFIEPSSIEQESIVLRDTELYHATRVLRLKKKDLFDAVDGQGRCFRVEILHIDKQQAECRILKRDKVERKQTIRLSLALALPKEKVMTLMLQKSVELGVYQIIPFMAERSQDSLTPELCDKKKTRWTQIVQEAVKQSGNDFLPLLQSLQSLEGVCAQLSKESYDEIILLSPWCKDSFIDFDHRMRQTTNPKHVLVCIGPEGGLTEEEEEQWKSHRAQSYKCGELLMRVETAMMFVATANYLWNLGHDKI